jgi:DNA-binding PadR family transcriptional regulator
MVTSGYNLLPKALEELCDADFVWRIEAGIDDRVYALTDQGKVWVAKWNARMRRG